MSYQWAGSAEHSADNPSASTSLLNDGVQGDQSTYVSQVDLHQFTLTGGFPATASSDKVLTATIDLGSVLPIRNVFATIKSTRGTSGSYAGSRTYNLSGYTLVEVSSNGIAWTPFLIFNAGDIVTPPSAGVAAGASYQDISAFEMHGNQTIYGSLLYMRLRYRGVSAGNGWINVDFYDTANPTEGLAVLGVTARYVRITIDILWQESAFPLSSGATFAAEQTVYISDFRVETEAAPEPPETPTDLTATLHCCNEVQLAWTAPIGAVSYRIERNGVEIAEGVEGTTYTDILSLSQRRSSQVYSVYAVNEDGESDPVEITVLPVFTTVTCDDVALSTVACTSVTLTTSC